MNQRGFTLIEIMVSMGISLVGIAAALGVLTAQNASFTRQSGLGSAVSQSVAALDFVENAVRMAGTGIDPQMAFDFDFYRCALPGGAVTMTDSAQCATATRDSATQPDDLVLAYRDQGYSTTAPLDARPGCSAGDAKNYGGRVWGVTAATASNITLVLKPGDTLYPGQVLQIVCATDGTTYTYATVRTKQSVLSTAAGCSSTLVDLFPAITNDPFNQPGVLAATCFSLGVGGPFARAYAVRRNRFFVRRDLTNPSLPHSYLMLDQGLDFNGNGLDDSDLLPIASDILDLQVAYATEQPGIMALPVRPNGFDTAKATYVVDSDANGIWGDTLGVAEQLTEPVFAGSGNVPTGQFDAANTALFGKPDIHQSCTGYATAGFYQYPCLFGIPPVEGSANSDIQAYRWTAWPGNISHVLIGIIGVGPVIEERAAQSADEGDLPDLLNRRGLAAPAYNAWYSSVLPAGRKRAVLRGGVRPTNMALASPFWN